MLLPRFIKVILVSFIFLLGFLTLTHQVNAQTSQLPTTSYQADSGFKMQEKLVNFSSLISCQIFGLDILQQNNGCYIINPITRSVEVSQPLSLSKDQRLGGLMGATTGLIGTMYTAPINTSDYTRYLASNFGIAKNTMAATTDQDNQQGFQTLNPLLSIWKVVRDFTYVIALIIFVIIGFGIMLRVKIDPRTVMSLQNQIPKIVIGLLLITFSYAIAGFFVDTMWLTTYLGINTVSKSLDGGTSGKEAKNATKELMSNPLSYVRHTVSVENTLFEEGVSGLAWSVGEAVGDTVSITVMSFFGTDGAKCDIGLTGGSISGCFKVGFRELLQFILNPIGAIIAAIVIFITMLRVWFSLLRAYVMILLDVCLAPFWIVMGLLPGSSMSFTKWLRHILSHLMVFPVTVLLLLFAGIFANSTTDTAGGLGTFVPPLVGNPSLAGGMGPLIAFGIILLTPQLLQIVRDAFGSKPSSNTAAIGKSLGIGAGVAAAGFSPVQKALLGKDKDHPGPLRYVFQRRLRTKASDITTNLANKTSSPTASGFGKFVNNAIGFGRQQQETLVLEKAKDMARRQASTNTWEKANYARSIQERVNKIAFSDPQAKAHIAEASKLYNPKAEDIELRRKLSDADYKLWKNS